MRPLSAGTNEGQQDGQIRRSGFADKYSNYQRVQEATRATQRKVSAKRTKRLD